MAETQAKRVIRYTPLNKILAWDRNPKTHAEGDIRASIERFGFTEPPIVDEKTGKLVSGHGRVDALRASKDAGEPPPEGVGVNKRGDWMVPVVRGISFQNNAEAEAYIIAANRLVEVGGWDDKSLSTMLEALNEEGGLAGVGWSEKELDTILSINDPAPVGQTPEEKYEGFVDAEIKQVVLFYSGAQYDAIIGRMDVELEARGLDNYSELFVQLLSEAENARATATGGATVSEGTAAEAAPHSG